MRNFWVWQVPLIALGGALGAVLRYGLSGLAHRITGVVAFPIGTLVVNVSGCLAIGIFGGWAESRQLLGPQARLFLFIGVLGAFTTFSTFGLETVSLLRTGDQARALGNVLLHVTLGLAAVWVGLALAEMG